ncbi:MAG: aromatic-ring-hydroxylating dioxygenase subunit beta [Sphingopyxis sp.]|uniref:aromatic-ring-hydroxylating dioxygenase subunit beta n=1 Tax=Sphingopyxis sp. TaxID=1908224 RepID=UPI001A29BE0F|nr:aromatic-ring-hydroxylating dioxygenase subunit beta [Sphingopyxis sp.]MBJ7499337.1 aromatic-ring-hydroxylating dioxygenase subunit beta [Sphingopyxis sp.]
MTVTLLEPAPASGIDTKAVEQFLFHEARLQDEHRYDQWEALWTGEDALYWVPMREGADPTREVSYIYDNRPRLASRIRQLNTGVRHSQAPQSRLRRLISNIEVSETDEGVAVESNFSLIESRRGLMTIWAGRTTHLLERVEDGFRIKRKIVNLVNCEEAIGNLAFLV